MKSIWAFYLKLFKNDDQLKSVYEKNGSQKLYIWLIKKASSSSEVPCKSTFKKSVRSKKVERYWNSKKRQRKWALFQCLSSNRLEMEAIWSQDVKTEKFHNFFKPSFKLDAFSKRFELAGSDWAHFLRLFKIFPEFINFSNFRQCKDL
jgi:hypothetical protein